MEPTGKLGRVVMIHGVKQKRKDRHALKRFLPAFVRAGFCVLVPKYGFIPALLVGVFKWIDNRIADSMSEFIRPDDIILGHSNGATLAYLISQKVKVRGVILVNAALGVDKVPNAEFVHVYFNDGDWVAWASNFLPFHPWGAMGKYGYLGNDPRVINIDQGNPPLETLPRLNGHSDVFGVGKTVPWTRYMASLAAFSISQLPKE